MNLGEGYVGFTVLLFHHICVMFFQKKKKKFQQTTRKNKSFKKAAVREGWKWYHSLNLRETLNDKFQITLNFRSQTVNLYQKPWTLFVFICFYLLVFIFLGGLGSPFLTPNVCFPRLEPCADCGVCLPSSLSEQSPESRGLLLTSAVWGHSSSPWSQPGLLRECHRHPHLRTPVVPMD